MYCHKCGFITKGVEDKCPYCGTPFSKPAPLDEKRFMLRWAEISTRQLISIIIANLFALICIIDIALVFLGPRHNYHLSPWAFLSLFGALFLINEAIAPRQNSNRLLFLKAFGFGLAFMLILMFSYPSWVRMSPEGTQVSAIGAGGYPPYFPLFGMSSYSLCFGYIAPVFLSLLFLFGLARYIAIKNFNVFSTFFYVLILLVCSAVLFIMTFIPQCGLSRDENSCIIIYVCFALNLLCAINAGIFSSLRMKSRFATKG